MTHPVCAAVWQRGMFWKVPPIASPWGTVTLPPMRRATMSWLRSVAEGSTSSCIRRVVMNVPCECPMMTTFRPPLSFFR